MRYFRRLNKEQLNKTTKLIIGGASVVGSTFSICIHYVIESLVISK
jgi:hypothetical protein